MSSSCHFAVYWTYSLLHQWFMPNPNPTKPLHPTSTGHMVAFQPASLQSSTRPAYLARFRSLAASMPSSHGTVSSTNKMVLHGSDHMIKSGRSQVFYNLPGELELPPQVDPHVPLAARWEDSRCCSLVTVVVVFSGPCKQDGKSCWRRRSTISLLSTWLCHLC